MKNIILTGFMGTGKTAVGEELARLLDVKLIDVDTEIEKSEDMTINDIFKQFGESRFREIETEMIRKLSENKNSIISTGGGAVLKQENMDIMRSNGVIVCLMATPETVLKRKSNNTDRNLVQIEQAPQKKKKK